MDSKGNANHYGCLSVIVVIIIFFFGLKGCVNYKANNSFNTRQTTEKLSDSPKIVSRVKNNTQMPARITGEFDVAPKTANIIVRDDDYSKPSSEGTTVGDAIDAIKGLNLNGFNNIKITIACDTNFGKWTPMLWYDFEPSKLKHMNTTEMTTLDFNNAATDHGNKKISPISDN